MIIKVLQENLSASLNNLTKAIPHKPQLPILSSILLEAKNNECTISATDLYFGVRSGVQADIHEEGTIVVPGKQFKEIISSLPKGVLTLEFKDKEFNILSEKTKTSLSCQVSDEYPPFPVIEGDEFDLSFTQLEKIEKLVSFSASLDQARPVLTAVLFKFSNEGLEVVTTDGFRLAILSLDNQDYQEEKVFLIPAKALSEVYRIVARLKVENVVFRISKELKQVFFSIEKVLVFIRLIDGKFPPYEKIIPSIFTTEVIFDTEELLENLKRATIFAKEASNIVRFEIKKNEVLIKSSSPSFGNYKGILKNVKVTGEEKVIAFNIKYLIDYLSAIKQESQWFGMNESLKPAMFKPEVESSYKYVVMPFKVNN